MTTAEMDLDPILPQLSKAALIKSIVFTGWWRCDYVGL